LQGCDVRLTKIKTREFKKIYLLIRRDRQDCLSTLEQKVVNQSTKHSTSIFQAPVFKANNKGSNDNAITTD